MAFGRFERPGDETPMSDINMTPLIDVMLVLLVIFILTAPLLDGRIALKLPQAAAPAAQQQPHVLTLSITRDGTLVLDGGKLDEAALQQRLRQAAATHPDTELRVRADTAVPYGTVARAMAAAQSAGLSRIGLLTQSSDTP